MNNKKTILHFLIVLAVFTTGCKKDLELLPTDSFDATKAYLSVNDLQSGLNTVYGRYSPENRGLVSAGISDEMKFGADHNGTLQFEYRFQYGADGTTGGVTLSTWGNMYSVIDQANRVLSAINIVPSANATDDARKLVIKGQALAFRAMGHFELLQQYSKKFNAADPLGVPLMTASVFGGKPVRSSVGAVMTQIEADLLEASTLLAIPVSAGAFDDKILNKITVDGIRARVALYKGDYPAAITFASNVINANLRPVVTGVDFANIWTDAAVDKEVLLRFRRGGVSYGNNYITTTNQVYLSPSDKLTASFAATDIRLANYITTVSGKRALNKYFTSASGARINDWKEMRTAEIYLIRAEAYAATAASVPANLALGVADLNLLRSARIVPYTAATYTDPAVLLNDVIIERYKELCFEGHRLFDLKRLGRDVVRSSTDVTSTSWLTLPATSHRFQMPIPASEILANPNMVPNPNY
jgi:starch-binding outer membrane protein, SusD/RagB family